MGGDDGGTPGWRTLTIDEELHRRLRSDIRVDTVRTLAGRRLRVLAVMVLLALAWGFSWRAIALIVGAVVVGQLVTWERRGRRSMTRGLGVGQSISLAYTETSELALRDVTDEIWLSRGFAAVAERRRGLVVVWNETFSFLLPGELVTDADLAFLRGSGAAGPATLAGPSLPLSVEVTPELQEQLVAAATRVRARSADFVMLHIPIVLILLLAMLAGSWSFVGGFAVVLGLVVLVGQQWLARARRATRILYPVGGDVRGAVTSDQLLVSSAGRTRRLAWRSFHSWRLVPGAVLLSPARGRPDATVVVPRALLTADALGHLEQVVGRRSSVTRRP